MTRMRPPVEILAGHAADVVEGLRGDFAILERGVAAARTWHCATTAVVLGASRDRDAEVDDDECRRRGVAVLRRASGGGTVLVGPGTVQYAFVVPHASATTPPSLDAIRSACNETVRNALRQSGVPTVPASDPSGDLRIDDRKVGGLAMRRLRSATLLHGTLLVDADLASVGALLRHPQREPAWRRGRAHADFLANLGALDLRAFSEALTAPFR